MVGSVMAFYLIPTKGKQKGQAIRIKIDLFMIGSDESCQLRNPNLAPQHCTLITRDKKVFIRDMDSGESTLVNDETMPNGSEWPLHKGDRIRIGNLHFISEIREKPLSQRDMEEWALAHLDFGQEQVHIDLDEDLMRAKSSNAADAAKNILSQLGALKGVVVGRLRIGREEGCVVVRFNDRHLVEEAEIAHIKQELTQNLNKPNLRVILDLKNVSRMSTAAVMMLSDLHRWLKPWGSNMALCRVRGELAPALELLPIEVIPRFYDKKAAFKAKW
jgi:anti-anti-sigma regulatory factor